MTPFAQPPPGEDKQCSTWHMVVPLDRSSLHWLGCCHEAHHCHNRLNTMRSLTEPPHPRCLVLKPLIPFPLLPGRVGRAWLSPCLTFPIVLMGWSYLGLSFLVVLYLVGCVAFSYELYSVLCCTWFSAVPFSYRLFSN
jgi:hypothetical protein